MILGICGAFAANLPDSARHLDATDTNSFPDPIEVLGGRAFATPFDREVYYLKRVREAYPSYWASLLGANILVSDYVVAPDKLQKFIDELGEAAAGTDDPVAATSLAVVTSDATFYANTNAFRAEILRAAARQLIRIGPRGRVSLAQAFVENHYRQSPESLEIFAEVIGQSGVTDPKLSSALAATAFTFTATNGGSFPGCTQNAVAALLRLPGGVGVVREKLEPNTIFDDPGRYQDVVRAIASAKAESLRPDLVRLESVSS